MFCGDREMGDSRALARAVGRWVGSKKASPEGVALGRKTAKYVEDALIAAGCVRARVCVHVCRTVCLSQCVCVCIRRVHEIFAVEPK